MGSREKIRIPSSGPFLTGGSAGDVITKNADGTFSVLPVTGGNLPPVTVDDNGDLLQVVAGVWAKSSPNFAITSFADGTSIVLVGANIVTPAFTAAYSQPSATATLSDNQGNPSQDVSGTPTAFSSVNNYQKNVFGQSVTWTLNATRGANSASPASVSKSWGQPNYRGSSVDPGIYTEAFIEGLASSGPVLSPNGTYAANNPVGEFEYFCARSGYGLTSLSFSVLGLPYAITKVAVIAVTNTNDITENYDVWKSDNSGLGAYNYSVSS